MSKDDDDEGLKMNAAAQAVMVLAHFCTRCRGQVLLCKRCNKNIVVDRYASDGLGFSCDHGAHRCFNCIMQKNRRRSM